MRRNLNKETRVLIDKFLIKHKTGSITESDYGYSYNLFAHIDEVKKVIAFLRSKGLDSFKKGTKEPIKIAEALATTDWVTVGALDPELSGARSMWD